MQLFSHGADGITLITLQHHVLIRTFFFFFLINGLLSLPSYECSHIEHSTEGKRRGEGGNPHKTGIFL